MRCLTVCFKQAILNCLVIYMYMIIILSHHRPMILRQICSYLSGYSRSFLSVSPLIMKMPVEECMALLTCSVRLSNVWKENISMESLFAMIAKIRFTEKQQQMIVDLVGNVFFYEDGESISSLFLLVCIPYRIKTARKE